jgi:hypothetical protein
MSGWLKDELHKIADTDDMRMAPSREDGPSWSTTPFRRPTARTLVGIRPGGEGGIAWCGHTLKCLKRTIRSLTIWNSLSFLVGFR